MNSHSTICIAGAGNIGCFVGGLLATGGHVVTFLARPRMIAELRTHGLHLTSFDGFARHVPANRLTLSDDAATLAAADIILVTVKSSDTASMADLIAQHAKPGAVVVSLQNGVGNVPVLREKLPQFRVLGGMVPFNVTAPGEGRFHRATSGDIVIEADASGTAARLSTPPLKVRASDNITGVQWGKLLLNLGNALNALSNLPLRDQLSQRAWRKLLADQMSEALKVMRAAGIKPAPPTPLPAAALPYVLSLPDSLFRRVAARMIDIDPHARSSMWDDLQRRRLTEIDDLQGVIIALAGKHGIAVPLVERIVTRIKQAEVAKTGSPGLRADEI
jgi:2-dehydropantoate 2-reductase